MLLFLLSFCLAVQKERIATMRPAQFQPITFKFGPDSTAITIDNAVQTIKNMPRGGDAKQLPHQLFYLQDTVLVLIQLRHRITLME